MLWEANRCSFRSCTPGSSMSDSAIEHSLNALGAANMMKGEKSVSRYRRRASESSDHVPGPSFEVELIGSACEIEAI